MIMKTVHKLTKEEVKALKTCDHVAFVYDVEKREDKAFIRATKELKGNVWEKEKVFEIETEVKICGKDTYKVKKCFYNIAHVSFTHWPTIAENLKEGDRLVLRWIATNNNQYLNNAGLFADELYLEVYREGRGKPKVKKFFVGYAVCQDNSARMCRMW